MYENLIQTVQTGNLKWPKNKLGLLINYVSHNTHEIILDC